MPDGEDVTAAFSPAESDTAAAACIDTSTTQSPPVPLGKNRNFRLLWIGQVLSDLGTEFGYLAYPLLVLMLTRSAIIAGAVGTAASVAAFAVRLPAGSLADRLNRRWTMATCDSIRAVVLAGLAAAVALHVVAWPVVMVVAVVDRVGDVIFTPSSMAALPAIVASEQLETAWAASEARQYSATLAGPALGGVLYGVATSLPFIGDAISYGVSALTAAAMRGNFTPPKADGPRRGLWMESFDAIQFMWQNALLRAVIIQVPLINLAFSGAIFTIILALRRNGSPASVIGLAEAAVGLGGLLGALVAPKLQGRLGLWHLCVLITAIGTLAMAAGAAVLPSPLVAVPIAFALFLAPTANAALTAAMLRATPDEMRGRVTNAFMQAAAGLATLAPLIAGVLVEDAPSNWAMGAFAVVSGISAVMALVLPGLRMAAAGSKAAQLASDGRGEGAA